MKKFLLIALALCLIFALAACGAAQDEEAATDEGGEEAAAEQTVLTMWCIATESDANRPAYEQAIAEFEEAHPDIKIEWEAFENESYKTKIKAAMSDPDTLPDIFFTWSGAFLGDFADAGTAYCLDEAYEPFAGELPEVMLSNSTYDGKHYAVPLTYNIVALFANMDLLAEAGYTEVPQTYEDLTACCDALLAKGIIPFGCAGKETWCVTEYLEPIIEKTIGYEALNAIFAGDATWNDPAIADAVSTFQDMINKGYFDPAGIALGNDEVKANFLAGKTAFYQNGSWNCGEVAAAGENFVAIPFPVIDAEKSTLYQGVGGPNDTLAVAATTANPEAAAKAALYLGKTISKEGNLIGSGLPCWVVNYDASSVNRVSNTVASWVANNEPLVLFGDNILPANEAGIYLDYISQIYAGAITAEQFAEGLEAEMLALK